MDKKQTGDTAEQLSPLAGFNIKSIIKGLRGGGVRDRFSDVILFIISFLFSACHIAFGVYPLSIALTSAATHSVVWIMAGGVIGALTVSDGGFILAVISLMVFLLRVIVMGSRDRSFSEPLVLRISISVISSFVGAVYRILLDGFTLQSVLYSVGLILLCGTLTLVFSGAFNERIRIYNILFKEGMPESKPLKEKFGTDRLLYQIAVLFIIFFISLSLKTYSFFGITPAYIFAGVAAIFTSYRLGPIYGGVVGFISSLAIEAVYSPAFALLGIFASFAFGFGAPYALIGGGIIVSVWCAYVGGVSGLLSTLPEYAAAASLSFPLIYKLPRRLKEAEQPRTNTVEEMVATTALRYKTKEDEYINLEESMGKLSLLLEKWESKAAPKSADGDMKSSLVKCIGGFCRGCVNYSRCSETTPAPCLEATDKIWSKINTGMPFDGEIPSYCNNKSALCENIYASLSESGREGGGRRTGNLSGHYQLFSSLIKGCREEIKRGRLVDTHLSETLSEIMKDEGIFDGVVCVIGEREKHIIGAGSDRSGKLVTKDRLWQRFEEAVGMPLCSREYYRKGDIALFECKADFTYYLEYATASKALGEINGDSTVLFSTDNGYFYSGVLDGVGSGAFANSVSSFGCEFLKRLLGGGVGADTALNILHRVISMGEEEEATTVDIFSLDRLSGEAVFYKSAAAPSYIKRGESIYRIKSETVPLGLTKELDTEKIRVEVKSGDYIIMLSDGVSGSKDSDTAMLLEYLNKARFDSVTDFAEGILDAAVKRSGVSDDMTVTVIKLFNRRPEPKGKKAG